MKAIILAAGGGARMYPLTNTRPKEMLPLANKPLLEYLLTELARAGILDIIVVVGSRGQSVIDYFGRGEKWGVRIEYCIQGEPTGTAAALETARGLVSGDFLLINGDIMLEAEAIKRVASAEGITLAVLNVDSTEGLGVIETAGARVSRINEKPVGNDSGLANAGLYRLTPQVFDAISRIDKSSRGEYEITVALNSLIAEGQLISYHEIDRWHHLGYPWDLLTANEGALSAVGLKIEGTVEAGAMVMGQVAIGEGTLVRAGSYIVGPVIIGRGCDIGPSCFIRPATSIGDNCRIGSAVEIKNSIIMKNSKIPHHNYIGDSIVGGGCNLGAGTKIANLRLDKKTISVGGVDTGRQKLGAVIGDGVETGVNVSIDAGSVIGDGARIGPGALVSGVIAPDARVFRETDQ